MSDYLTDEERQELAENEYENYSLGQPVELTNGKIIGYASEVHDNWFTGEQSYVITDIPLSSNPTEEELANVTNVITYIC